ncbi:serine hydrolase domain-containing protein [Solibacillus sp. CAU 1738]|uniref:serine hydrolase domain-containing protein n=1 Tax=Solibacillus sp. CAU 1738 TaxID=3140363 RepID=UPI00326179A0
MVGFEPVIQQVKHTFQQLDCSAGGLMIVQDNEMVVEEYWGTQSKQCPMKTVNEQTQFHLASIRKTYIGFAAAYALYHGYIRSLDDEITLYLKSDLDVLKGVTIRHLLTHTHGLRKVNEDIIREFEPGENWAYRGIGVDLLVEIIHLTTKQTAASILHDVVFKPLNFKETNWVGALSEHHVEVIHHNSPFWYESELTDGSKMNMYASIRELAQWGLLHLHKGVVNDVQVIPKEIFELATAIQAPKSIPSVAAKNGFFWFVQENERGVSNSELSPLLPEGSYQLLGYTSVAILVIPLFNLVAVRAFNSFGSPDGFNYLDDVHDFGALCAQCSVGDE